MESSVDLVLPAKSASVFSLVTTQEPVVYDRNILVVIDRRKNITNKKKKWPGGGVVENEGLDDTAKSELLEETGLREFRRQAILLEVHKPSRDHPNEVHKDIFFLGYPTEQHKPIPGYDIEYAGWEPVREVLREIQRNGFLPNHKYAFLWWLTKDEFLKTGRPELIRSILSDPTILLIGVKNETMVLCLAGHCEECQKARRSGLMQTPLAFGEKVSRAPEEKQITEIQGKTYFIIYHGTRFDDYVLFWKDKADSHLLPCWTVREPIPVAEIAKQAGEQFGGAFSLIGCKQTERFTVVLLYGQSLQHMSSMVCVSRPPNLNFAMPIEEWHAFLAAVPLLEKHHFAIQDTGHTPVVNHHWKAGWHDRVPIYGKSLSTYDRLRA